MACQLSTTRTSPASHAKETFSLSMNPATSRRAAASTAEPSPRTTAFVGSFRASTHPRNAATTELKKTWKVRCGAVRCVGVCLLPSPSPPPTPPNKTETHPQQGGEPNTRTLRRRPSQCARTSTFSPVRSSVRMAGTVAVMVFTQSPSSHSHVEPSFLIAASASSFVVALKVFLQLLPIADFSSSSPGITRTYRTPSFSSLSQNFGCLVLR
mmetsp:Transcript_27593/g.67107  ORF Transcript_27593/g.67107 Transcript_27593/m.67107 type:complete len:211 (+) Transcript_27593:1343-1975(+)